MRCSLVEHDISDAIEAAAGKYSQIVVLPKALLLGKAFKRGVFGKKTLKIGAEFIFSVRLFTQRQRKGEGE